MKRFNGGNWVRGGYYLNLKTWEVCAVGGDNGALPGAAADRLIHLPLPMVFVVAPVLGGLFAIFLPFIGFAMTFHALGKGLLKALPRRAAKVVQQH